MDECWTYLITWNTYGNWLPGDSRGWRCRKQGQKLGEPRLEAWSKDRLRFPPVILQQHDRESVEEACRKHCHIRGWVLHAVNARSNHVHVVVSADTPPRIVRDQLKANCTRQLRNQDQPLLVDPTWAKGGDTEILDDDDDLQASIRYVLEAQDR